MLPQSVFQKVHNAIIKYFVWMLPIGLLIIVGSLGPSIDIQKMASTPIFYLIVGAGFIAWIISSFYFFVSLLVSKSLREQMLARIAGVKETDEREEYIVGRSAKASLLFTMAFLIVLFGLSTWRYGESIEHPADFQSLTVGHFHLKTNSDEPTEQRNDEKGTEHTVKLYDIPLSKSSLILLVLFVQGFAYRYFAWRYERNQ